MAETSPLIREFDPAYLKTLVFKTPLNMFCGKCEMHMPSTMEWVCGYCRTEHRDVRLHTFLYHCKTCKRQPRSFECPHCKTIWCMDSGRDGLRPARRIESPTDPTSPPETEFEKRKRELFEKKQELDSEIAIAQAEVELAKQKNDLAKAKPKTFREKIKAAIKKRSDLNFGIREELIAEEKRLKQSLKGDRKGLQAAKTYLKTTKEDLENDPTSILED